MRRQLRAQGGIMNVEPRKKFGVGSVFQDFKDKVVDRTRKIMTQQFTDDYYEKKLGDGGTGHIMARCNLIHDYLDHRKGKRKSQKHSPEWLRR